MTPNTPAAFAKEDYRVRTVPLATCEDLVRRFHYARGGPNTATFRHGLFRVAEPFRCLGVAWWIPPIKAAAVATYDGDWQRVLSLTRLVVVPGLPTNAASFLIGRSVRLIRQSGTWECLVTYADTWQAHTGTIYHATNWEYLGLTPGDPIYVDVDGRMVARKAGPTTRTRSEMAALGHSNLGTFPKHKFRMLLGHSSKRQLSFMEDASA